MLQQLGIHDSDIIKKKIHSLVVSGGKLHKLIINYLSGFPRLQQDGAFAPKRRRYMTHFHTSRGQYSTVGWLAGRLQPLL